MVIGIKHNKFTEPRIKWTQPSTLGKTGPLQSPYSPRGSWAWSQRSLHGPEQMNPVLSMGWLIPEHNKEGGAELATPPFSSYLIDYPCPSTPVQCAVGNPEHWRKNTSSWKPDEWKRQASTLSLVFCFTEEKTETKTISPTRSESHSQLIEGLALYLFPLESFFHMLLQRKGNWWANSC